MFEVDGFRFGYLPCIEVQFPELFAEYERPGVDCLLFSAYSNDPMFGIQAQTHVATNYYWIGLAMPAPCGKGLPSAMIGPDGHVISQAPALTEPRADHMLALLQETRELLRPGFRPVPYRPHWGYPGLEPPVPAEAPV